MHYILCFFSGLYLQESTLSSQPWRFDPLSALVGAVAVALLVGLLYAFRAKVRQVWGVFAAAFAKFMNYMRASADENYRRLVAAEVRAFVIPAHIAPLEALFVEPRLLVPPRSSQSLSEVTAMAVAPRLMPLHQTLEGHPRMVILGDSGMGKTATLGYLALVCATAFERDEKRRVDPGPMPESVLKRLPLYIVLSAMDWGGTDQEEEIAEGESAEKEAVAREAPRGSGPNDLIRAAVSAVEGGAGYAGALRQYLETGRAIVLVDGWDELTLHQRELAAAWLDELADALPGNIWLVAVGTRGYASLTEVGFVSLHLAPWDGIQVETFAKRWVEARAPEEKSSTLLHNLETGLQRVARLGASPLELTLRTFVYLSDRQMPDGRAALFGRALDLLLEEQGQQEEEPWWLAACHTTLGQVALELQQGGRSVVSGEEIEAVIEAALPPQEERPVRAVGKVFQALTGELGLFRPVGSRRYTFVHPLWQAYLAARQLVAFEPDTLVRWLEDPLWSEVFHFYAELGDMRPMVEAWLRTPDDVFYTRLCTLGSWIGAAPEGAAWREGAMAILARAFLQSNTYASTRQTLAEALAATGVSGVSYFLKQAVKRPETEVRVAAILGLSKVAKEADMPVFEEALVDEDVSMREAAVRALGWFGTDAAKRRLAVVLLEGDDELRPVAAVVLARCGEEGVELLHELVGSEDVMTRRAVVSGLAQIGARDALEGMARDDGQWIVRTAATAALEELQAQEKEPGAPPLPEVEQLPWLISWAATQGEGVGLGDAARRMLQRALLEGDEQVRMAAAQVLIRIARPDDVQVLRSSLADSEPLVADAALKALEEIGKRYDLRVTRK